MNWTVKLIKSSLIFQKPRKNQPLVANFHLSSPKPQSHQKQLPFLFLITKSKIEDVFLLWKRFLKWSKILSTSLELQLRLTTLQSDDPFTPNLFYLFRIRNSFSKQEPTNIKEIHNLSNLFRFYPYHQKAGQFWQLKDLHWLTTHLHSQKRRLRVFLCMINH